MGDLVVGDSGEGISEPCLGIDAVELGGFDQGVGDGCGASAGERTDEEVVLSADGDGSHRTFGRVVVEFQDAVIEIRPHPSHAGQGVADRHGEGRLAGDAGQLEVQPGLEVVEDRHGLRLPDLDTPVRWRAPRFLLDGIELGDARDGLVGDR